MSLEVNGWIKTIFYLGLFYLIGTIIILVTIHLGLKPVSPEETSILYGLGVFAIFAGGLATLYYLSVSRGYFNENTLSKKAGASIFATKYLGFLGSITAFIPCLFFVMYSFSDMVHYVFYNMIYLGLILILVSLSLWLYNIDERQTAKIVKRGLIFPLLYLAVYDTILVSYNITHLPALFVLGIEVLVGGIIYSLLVLLVGLEEILSHNESYLVGSVYTIAALLVVIYIVQALTTLATTSILAENLVSCLGNKLSLTITFGDKVGLLIISYRIYFALLSLLSILYLVAILVLVRKKSVYVAH